MEIEVIRKFFRDTYTIGELRIDGKKVCDTLEDKDRCLYDTMKLQNILRLKVKGQTAIPYGKYDVRLTYSQRFKRILPLVLPVKGFDGIRIHAGNTDKDTEGCLLLGENKQKGKVLNSRHWAYEVVLPMIDKTIKRGESVFITYKKA